jgi:hypothetical protein
MKLRTQLTDEDYDRLCANGIKPETVNRRYPFYVSAGPRGEGVSFANEQDALVKFIELKVRGRLDQASRWQWDGDNHRWIDWTPEVKREA